MSIKLKWYLWIICLWKKKHANYSFFSLSIFEPFSELQYSLKLGDLGNFNPSSLSFNLSPGSTSWSPLLPSPFLFFSSSVVLFSNLGWLFFFSFGCEKTRFLPINLTWEWLLRLWWSAWSNGRGLSTWSAPLDLFQTSRRHNLRNIYIYIYVCVCVCVCVSN